MQKCNCRKTQEFCIFIHFLSAPQSQLCIFISGIGGRVLCHGGVWDLDPAVPGQSSGGAEDSSELHLSTMQQQRQVPTYTYRWKCNVQMQILHFWQRMYFSLISSLIFGAITCVTGLLGVVIGAVTTRLCRQKTERADPLVCAVSMLGSAIFICLIFVVAKKSIVGAYVSSSILTVQFQLTSKLTCVCTHTAIQKFGISKIFNVFLSLLCS